MTNMADHPDLEALSASLDGEDEGARRHAAACGACGAQVAGLRAARDAVAAPVTPVVAGARDGSILAALDVFGGRAAGAGVEVGTGAAARSPAPSPAPSAEVVSLASRRWQWVAGGAVAAVLVLIVGMATLFGGGVSRESDTAAQAPFAGDSEKSADNSTGAGVGGTAGTATAGSGAVTEGGDLGEVASLDALRSRTTAARANALGAPASGASSGATAESAGAPPQPVQVGTRACEIEARAARPQVGVVVYAATARFQGQPSVVLGFSPTAGAPPTVLLVLSQAGCRLLGEA